MTSGQVRTVEVVIDGAERYPSIQPKRKAVRIPFMLFDGLSEPFVIGMPSIDRLGGLEVYAKHLWFGGLWIPRALNHQNSKGTLRQFNIAYTDVDRFMQIADGSEYVGPAPPPQTFPVRADGWTQVTTYWPPNLADKLAYLEARDGYIEVSPEWENKIEVISTIVPFDGADVVANAQGQTPHFLELELRW